MIKGNGYRPPWVDTTYPRKRTFSCRNWATAGNFFGSKSSTRLIACSRVSPPNKHLCKPYVCTAEGEERHPQDHLHSGVGHQKGLLENRTFPGLSWSEKTQAIMAIETNMAIVTVSQSFRNCTGYQTAGKSSRGGLRGTVHVRYQRGGRQD